MVEEVGRVGQGRAVLTEPVRSHIRVVELGLVLERRDHHHVERIREHDRERPDDEVCEPPLAQRAVHETSLLRANSSITMLTTASTGNSESEIAAPGPSEPDSIAVLYDHVVTISVLKDGGGPPWVRM